jgi:DNA-binding SARP family transcriptional activator/tetratricopeptide (TPR) repeat protein
MHDRISSPSSKEGAEPAAVLYGLGNFRLCAVEDGADLAPRGRKARALIAYLALNGGPVSRERLAGLLWGERGEEQARASLRNTLLELRALSSNGSAALVVEREHVGVVPGRVETDLTRLLAWAASGNLAAIDECLGPWDGRIFGDLDSIDGGFDDWLAGERTRQQEKMFAALIAALDAAPANEVEHARSIADKLLQVEPTNEAIVRLAMRADRSAKDVSAIRRRYKRLENQLRTEFNAAPSADTRRLYDELAAGTSAEDHVNAAATALGNGHAEPPATGEATRETRAAQAPPFSVWRWIAAAATVAAVGAAAIAVTASHDWRSGHTVDLVELRPLFVLDGTFEGLAQQTHGTLKRVLASHQVAIVDSVSAASGERPTKAEFALTGSLEGAGGQISVTLYLDNVQDGQTLWSRRFVRASGGSEELQDAIGARAAFMIGCALRQRRLARVQPTIEAFKIYLETCDPELVWDNATVLAAAQRLVEVAPNDAYGHGLIAVVNAYMTHDPTLTDSEMRVFRHRADTAASRASQLDATSPLPFIAHAMAMPPAQSWQEREIYYQRARADYSTVWDGHVNHLRASGRVEEAMRALELCLAQLPLSANAKTFAAVLQMQLGKHERAHLLFSEAVELWPNIAATRWYRFVNLAFYGNADNALNIVERESGTLDIAPDDVKCWRTFIEARHANRPDVAAVRKACANLMDDYLSRMLAVLGDTNGALEAISAKRMDWHGATIAFFYPEMKRVRHDRRFMSAIVDSGLVEFWATSGQWPDFCSDKDLPYSCEEAAAEVLARKTPQSVPVPD